MKKKLVSMLLLAAMLLTVCVGAMADRTINIVDTEENDFSRYAYVQLMSVTNVGTNFSYTINSAYRAKILEFAQDADKAAGLTDASPDSAILATITDSNVRAFAEAIAAVVDWDAATRFQKTSSSVTVPEGYYLIKDTKIVSGLIDEASSLIIIDTVAAGSTTMDIHPKKAVPTVDKKVKEDEATGGVWQEVAEYDIGDMVEFKVTGTVASNYDQYSSYTYVFHDTLQDTFGEPTDIHVVLDDGTDVTSSFTSAYDAAKHTLTVTCTADQGLKGIAAVQASSKVILTYKAELLTSAIIGNPGNENTVYLEYSNNPNVDGTGSTGRTPEHKVVVFTFAIKVSKVDQAGAALDGAIFELLDAGKNVINLIDNKNGTYTIGTTGETVTKFMIGEATIIGLDADATADGSVFYLNEITPPTGYNKLDKPVAIRLKAIYAAGTTDNYTTKGEALTGLKAEYSLDGGSTYSTMTNPSITGTPSASLTVENHTGTELPSTGGMGTTLFIVGGAVLMVAALALLLVARRKHA